MNSVITGMHLLPGADPPFQIILSNEWTDHAHIVMQLESESAAE